MTITITWWMWPTVITLAAILGAIFLVEGGDGYYSGVNNIFALVPALAVSCLAWIITAILK